MARVYLSQTRPREGMEVQWDRNARLSISRTSLWLNASNWLRICGIASGLTVRRSHSHLPKRRSLIDGWRSCGVVQTQVCRGTLSAAGSTIACGGQIDDSSPRSACRRGGYRRSGALVRETFIGFGQRVPWLSGSEYRRCPANARCLPQNTRGRSTSPAPTLSVRAVLLTGTLGYTCHRVPARAARPGSLAASNSGPRPPINASRARPPREVIGPGRVTRRCSSLHGSHCRCGNHSRAAVAHPLSAWHRFRHHHRDHRDHRRRRHAVGTPASRPYLTPPSHLSTWMRQELDAMPVEVGVTKRLGVRMLMQPAVSGE